MSDENQLQNPNSEENSIPPSPSSSAEGYGRTQQEPTPPSHEASGGQSEPASENTADSEPSVAPPEAPESSPSDFSVKSNDIPPSDSTHIEPEIPLEPADSGASPASNGTGPSEPEPSAESESIQAGKATAQIPVFEPLI